ncbi:uncharacterized protein F5891DRAFT_1200556 [Suillus fuscotomentosus]|uniref:Homeobox domain-containing protein n=1 Tax=Suillus fuscotomentosus TaxID=1912939 RepID=A0AAD4DNR9_9AGAM|nr:uncharacterized protein F5891DRAFT_1200556 [Suillus fuscotomentosus]KAG1886876.1 hypothetical protein F5891DRAFT_1200556 [Suillus fuscotomentosus]
MSISFLLLLAVTSSQTKWTKVQGVDPTSELSFLIFQTRSSIESVHLIQLKVLEDIFRKDTKPNAALRKKLAAELDILPRAVQVWFQNRRAKDKALRTPSPMILPILPPPRKNPRPCRRRSTTLTRATSVERLPAAESPLTKFSFSLPAPPTEAWHSDPATPAEIPHIGSLPITASTSSTDTNQPPSHRIPAPGGAYLFRHRLAFEGLG